VSHLIATGSDAGGGPNVMVFKPDGTIRFNFYAYDPSVTGGVRVAVGDVNGDGIDDIITVPGPGFTPEVRVWDGSGGALIKSFLAYDAGFQGGVYLAAADINGDGKADIITGAGSGGGPHVKVFDGATFTVIQSFMAYSTAFTGGVRVAAGDFTGDGRPDVITGAGSGGGPHVKVFNGVTQSLFAEFMAFDQSYLGGVFVAAGRLNADNLADIAVSQGGFATITPPGIPGGSFTPAHVRIFDAASQKQVLDFDPYADLNLQPNGIRVAIADRNGDGTDDLIVAPGPGTPPKVRVFSGATQTLLEGVDPYNPGFLGGVYVA
jgi:hypothetical protein